MNSKYFHKHPFLGRNITERKEIYGQLKSAFVDSVSKVSCLVSESMNTDNKIGRDVTISSSINVLDRNAPPEVYFWTGIIEGGQIFF